MTTVLSIVKETNGAYRGLSLTHGESDYGFTTGRLLSDLKGILYVCKRQNIPQELIEQQLSILLCSTSTTS